MTAAELAFQDFSRLSNNESVDPPTKAVQMLAYARFFCESCGWCALAIRKLRHEKTTDINKFLSGNKRHIDNLYELRKAVNHHYNEDLADEYRTGNYKAGRHQEKLAFIFSYNPELMSFRIGTLEISMISQLASMAKLENELLAL